MFTLKGLRIRRFSVIIIAIVIFLIIFYKFRTTGDPNLENLNSIILLHDKPKLAILVPFRDRFDELITFVPYMNRFLSEQKIGPFKIYILNQSNKYRFNRGALVNVGFKLTRDWADYIAIHDIDLLPLNKNLSYSFPVEGPTHLTSPKYHPNYNYDKYFGGVLLIRREHFELVNGFSNRYFGWGLEDDEFFARVMNARLPIRRPQNLTTDRNSTFLHFHHGRKRDTSKSREQREKLRHRDNVTGLQDLRFSLTSQHNITIDRQFDCLVFNIDLFCDIKRTPWCLSSHVKLAKH